MSTAPETADDHRGVAAQLDRISLAQAIQDVEIANSRVMDLTQRLIAANNEIVGLRRRVDETHFSLQQLRDEHDSMKGSVAFRIASRIWAIRNAVGR